jgi:hypothetical protein
LLLGANHAQALVRLLRIRHLQMICWTDWHPEQCDSDVKRLRTKLASAISGSHSEVRATADPVAFAMMLLDDITERRALERTISTSAMGSKKYCREATACARRKRSITLGKVLSESTIAAPDFQCGAGKAPANTGHSACGYQCDRQAPCAVLIAKDGQLLHANPKHELFGYSSEDLIR